MVYLYTNNALFYNTWIVDLLIDRKSVCASIINVWTNYGEPRLYKHVWQWTNWHNHIKTNVHWIKSVDGESEANVLGSNKARQILGANDTTQYELEEGISFMAFWAEMFGSGEDIPGSVYRTPVFSYSVVANTDLYIAPKSWRLILLFVTLEKKTIHFFLLFQSHDKNKH